MATGPVVRQGFGSTLRQDTWWTEIVPVVILLGGFGVYATLRAFEGAYYEWGPYLSPFYSPLIDPGHTWWPLSPALLILIFPLGFRATCYYYRKAYYRAFFLDPAACAVGEPQAQLLRRNEVSVHPAEPSSLLSLRRHRVHRYSELGCRDEATSSRTASHIGVGSLVLTLNAVLLGLYTFSCHSWRHLVGGKLDCFSCAANVRHKAWERVELPERAPHGLRVVQPGVGGLLRLLRAPAGQRRHSGYSNTVTNKYETHEHDVLIIGAGGAGLRAAIEALAHGAKVGLVCKSLLGKAHTVMAEGGIAAAMGNVDASDDWRTHFRDTMRGGKFMNHWRMAQLHAQEAPDRINELEQWGALFDRTESGKILQRAFGGHTYKRLCHVGDRTGLEMIRTLQDRGVSLGVDVYMECTVTRLLTDGGRVAGAFAYWREQGRFVVFKAKSVVLRHRRHRQGVRSHVEFVGVHRRRAGSGVSTPAPSSRTWNSCSSIRRAWSGRRA